MQKRPKAKRGVRPSKVLVHHICNLRYCCDSNASLQVYNDLCFAQMGLVPSCKGFVDCKDLTASATIGHRINCNLVKLI